MYTERQVKQFLRPVAVWVLLVFGSLPGVTLACQWACVENVGHAHHHTSHQATEGSDASAVTTDGPSLVSSDMRCDHAAKATAAVTSTGLKLYAPAATELVAVGFAVQGPVVVPAEAHPTNSPPGGRSHPLPLRL